MSNEQSKINNQRSAIKQRTILDDRLGGRPALETRVVLSVYIRAPALLTDDVAAP